MPLVTEKRDLPVPVEREQTPITPKPGQRPDGEFKNSVVDVRKRSVETLMAHVDGSHWKVDYYRQLLTIDMEPTAFQITQYPPFQQYEKINGYPIRVVSPISSSQNAETLLFTVNGSGILPFAIIPNVGDVFRADIGDGRYGIFSITNIVRKTILKDSVYEIDYSLLRYSTDEINKILDSRVVRELFYSDDHLGSGRGPLITSKELNDYRSISKIVNRLIFQHIHKFLDKDNTTLVVPSTVYKIYDPYFSLFWDKIIPKEKLNLLDIPNIYIVGDEYKEYRTIWNLILYKFNDINNIQHGVKLDYSASKNVDIIYSGISMTNISRVISVDEYFLIPEPYEETEEEFAEKELPDFHPVSLTGYYVLSSYFYTGRIGRYSKLERLVANHLLNKPLNMDYYFRLINRVGELEDLDQFYYIPILVILGLDYLRFNS